MCQFTQFNIVMNFFIEIQSAFMYNVNIRVS